MNRFKNPGFLILSVLLLTSFINGSQKAQAQYGQNKIVGGTQKYNGKNIKPQEESFHRTRLDRPVSLPNVPDYTGKQHFISGLYYPNAINGPGWMLVFNVEEHTKDQVLTWWKNALRMNQWKIIHSGNKGVRGTQKDGSTVSISVEHVRPSTKDKMKKCRASYTVFYHQLKKSR